MSKALFAVLILALPLLAGCVTAGSDFASAGNGLGEDARQSARVSANHYRYPANRPVGWTKGD